MWAHTLVGPGTFEAVDVPRPAARDLRPGQVLLRLLAGGICGSDAPFWRGSAHDWRGGKDLPGFPMHEIVGEVLACESTQLALGDRVVGWATGMDGLQEVMVSEAESLHPYRARLSAAEAVMLQPLACALHAVQRLGAVNDLWCAVLGQGPIGVLFSHILKSAGAARVTGVDRVDRRGRLACFGVGETVFASSGAWAQTLAGSDQPDVVVEAIGHQVGTLGHAIEAVRPGGRILYFGVPDDEVYPMPMERFLRKHLTLTACATVERRRALAMADEYIRAHPELVANYVTDRFTPSQVAEAYTAAFTPSSKQFKVVIDVGNARTGA